MSKVYGLLMAVLLLAGCGEEVYVENALVHSIPTESKLIIALSDVQDLDNLLKDNPLFDQLQGLTRMREIEKASSFLKNYDLDSDSFIALSIEGKNKVAITLLTEDYTANVDSNSIKGTIDYNDTQITERTLTNSNYYAADKNGIHMASSSLLVLESLIRRDVADYVFDTSFEKLFERTHNDISFYIKATDQKWLYQFMMGRNKADQGNFAQWYQLEAKKDVDALHMEGLIVYRDSIKQQHALYNNLNAQENQADKIAPAVSKSISSITYTDEKNLINNLTTYYNRAPAIPKDIKEILSNSQEITEIQLENGNALAFTVKPYETFFMSLDSLSSAKSTYRDQLTYTLSQPIETSTLYPLLIDGAYDQVALLDNFLILATDVAILEEMISSYENGSTLANQPWWQTARKSMSNSSTLLKVVNVSSLKAPTFDVSKEDEKILNELDTDKSRAIISQYVHEDSYAFYRMYIPLTSGGAGTQPLVAQIGTYKSEQEIIAGPFLFPNHLNNSQDVAIQTSDLKLTLISANGTPYWSKQLDSEILGGINAVDVYKNERQQLLFSTSKSLYLLDREGEDVDKFPYTTKNTITQPLSVFDYKSDRNYRFVVTTGDDLTLLDSKGNKVSGFNYKRSGAITSSPKHFRKETDDYIAFTTDNNQLKLLSRTGEVRTNIKQKIKAKSELFFHNNLIQLVNSDDKLLQINPSTGKVATTNTSLNADSTIDMTERSQLIQNKNVLQLNGNKLTLPYGTYTVAKISNIGREEFAAVVDQGENKVYIINSKADILPFLPVYGNQSVDIGGSKQRYMTTRDGNDVIIYSW